MASERGMLDLRTRTIVFELTRELEACRIRSERDASEKAETVSRSASYGSPGMLMSI